MLVDLVPIKALTPDHCQELADKSEFCKLDKGKPLFREGEESNRVIYLISGEVELSSSQGSNRIIVGGTKAAKLPLEQNQVHQFTATTRTDASFIKVDSNLLDISGRAFSSERQEAAYKAESRPLQSLDPCLRPIEPTARRESLNP